MEKNKPYKQKAKKVPSRVTKKKTFRDILTKLLKIIHEK